MQFKRASFWVCFMVVTSLPCEEVRRGKVSQRGSYLVWIAVSIRPMRFDPFISEP